MTILKNYYFWHILKLGILRQKLTHSWLTTHSRVSQPVVPSCSSWWSYSCNNTASCSRLPMMTATSWRGDTGRGNLVTAPAGNKQPWMKEGENATEVPSETAAKKLWNSLSAISIRLSICFLKISELKSSLKRLCNPQLKRENTGRLCYCYCQHSLTKVKPWSNPAWPT